jgi:signal transduction histidine kinase
VRHIESQSNVITDPSGHTERVVLVSRDVSARVQTENKLRQALADARRAHEQLHSAQQRIVQAERLEAVSTFAATVAHEVKNPLQTIVLGLDYLGDSIVTRDENGGVILRQMTDAVEKADAFIRGLLEFSAHRALALKEHDLGELLRVSLADLGPELRNNNVTLVHDYCDGAPLLRLDDRSIKHVLVTLLTHEIQCMGGGVLAVRTFLRDDLDSGKRLLVADIESRRDSQGAHDTAMARKMDAQTKFRMMVSKKVLELYGGRVDYAARDQASRYTISFTT